MTENFDALPLVSVEGPPRERGRQHGELAAERVHIAAENYLGHLDRLGLSQADLKDLASSFADKMASDFPELIAEIRGIAEGAGRPFEHIMMVNARREMLAYASRKRDVLPNDGCTAAAILPGATSDGTVLHGQNWDGSPEHAKHCIILRIRRDDGPDVLCFTEAGQLGRIGFNEAGVAVTGNHLESDRDFLSNGVPITIIRRSTLDCANYSTAIHVVYSTPKSCSNNMMISHKLGEAIDIECAPDESFLLYPSDDILTHSNNWQNVSALAKLKDTGATHDSSRGSITACSIYRAHRLHRLLSAQRGNVTVRSFKDALLDRFDDPFSICRPPRPAPDGKYFSCTTVSVVMSAEEGFMDVAVMPALNPQFTRYSLDPKEPQLLT